MTNTDYQHWICDACGFIYDEAKGDPDSGLPPGTRYQDIPEDWECPLCGLRKSDLRLLPETPVASPGVAREKISSKAKAEGGSDYIVIIGAGIAGWSAAEAIRRRDTQTPILLVTACKGLVYSKPALSLAISQGRSVDDLVQMDAASRAAELGIEVRTETRILAINSKRKRITTAKGGISYGKVILALGAQQRALPIEGDAIDTVLRVNDLSSFANLQQQLTNGVKSVTILGAGLIGSEFADDLIRAGYSVTVIDPAQRPLSGLVPEAMAEEFQERLAAYGVDWRLGVTLKSLDKNATGLKALLSDGSTLSTDLVLSAAGLLANTALAKKSGLKVDVGIAVDSAMRTSDSDIYAIGDCASVEGKLFAYIEPIRRQAEAIAADLAGADAHFEVLPTMVKIKTRTMPMSICRPDSKIEHSAWQVVCNNQDGSHFEVRMADVLSGFALSDALAADAANHYHKLTG